MQQIRTTQWARVETLPPRLLLSAETPSISVVDGILRVAGTDQNDHVELTTDSLSIVVQGGDGSPATDSQAVRVRIGALDESFAAGSLRGVQIRAGAGDDVVDCSGIDLPVTIWGGTGKDQLTGGTAADEIHGGGGADSIRALAGNDTVYGGAGNDSISLGAGNDLAFGGDGNDQINGKRGSDTLYGGNGDDTLYAGSSASLVLGEAGNDTLYTGGGSDTLRGGDGNDQFEGWGDNANALFDGGAGQDRLTFIRSRPNMKDPHTIDIEDVIVGQIQG